MGLEGKLNDMPVLDLLRVFQRGASSGKLSVWTEAAHAIVWFQDGQAVNAVVLRRSDLRPLFVGEHAISDLFTWHDGNFRFAEGDTPTGYAMTVTQPTNALIIKALQQRAVALDRRPADDLTMQTPVVIMTQMAGVNENIHMSVEEWYVLTHIGQQATIEQLVNASGLPAERIFLAVQHLIDSGLVMRAPLANLPPRQPAAASDANLTRAIRRRLQQISA